jgi:ribosomal protein S20
MTSTIEATRRVTANEDRELRNKACRAIMREAARRCAEIGTGTTVQGVEELELSDALEKELARYLNSRATEHRGHKFLGVTGGMDQIGQRLEAALTQPQSEEGEQGKAA